MFYFARSQRTNGNGGKVTATLVVGGEYVKFAILNAETVGMKRMELHRNGDIKTRDVQTK